MRTISLRSAQIRDLEAQVRELEETANRRAAPDSISQLIRAIGPSESVEVKRKETNREVVNLRKELAQTEADGEKRLRSLRQQFERVKLGLEGELSSLKRKMGSGGGVSSSVDKSSTGTGTTGTGGDVEKLRAFYNKKIADAEKKHTAALHAAKRGASNVSKSNPIKVDKNNAVERVRELEGLVSKQKEMILTLETLSSVKKGKGADNNSSVRSSNGEAAATAVNVAKIGQLEQMNVFLERQVKDLTSSLAGAETRVAQQQVSERTERALWKTGILATTKLTLFHSIRLNSFSHLFRSAQQQQTSAQQQQTQQQLHTLPPPPPQLPQSVTTDNSTLEILKAQYERRISDLQRQLVTANNAMSSFQVELNKQRTASSSQVASEMTNLQITLQTVRNELTAARNQHQAQMTENMQLQQRLSVATHSSVSQANVAQYAVISKQVNEAKRPSLDEDENTRDGFCEMAADIMATSTTKLTLFPLNSFGSLAAFVLRKNSPRFARRRWRCWRGGEMNERERCKR